MECRHLFLPMTKLIHEVTLNQLSKHHDIHDAAYSDRESCLLVGDFAYHAALFTTLCLITLIHFEWRRENQGRGSRLPFGG
jgi:hypothetical protein